MDSLNFIYVLLIAAMVALYLMMPRGRRPGWARLGILLGAIALIWLVTSLLGIREGQGYERAFFGIFSFLAVAAAAMMITQRKPLYSALFFVLTVIAVAALLLLQQAEFLSFALIVIYGGAILVTYLFVLMLSRQDVLTEHDTKAKMPLIAMVIGLFMLVSLFGVTLQLSADDHDPGAGPLTMEQVMPLKGTGTPKAIGRELFDNHVLAVQVAGVLLLVAAVGGIALVKNLNLLK